MPFSKRLDQLCLLVVLLVSRYLTRSHVLYDLDSVNFAFALDHFDPAAHQPHPPGYFLYVLLGRAVRLLISDPNDALVGISIVCSALAGWCIYRLGDEWFGRRAALFATSLFAISPLVWFHGTVALTYIVEMMFSAAIGYLCWRAYQGSYRHAAGAAFLVGIAAGFRQSSALFLLPMLVLSVHAFGWKRIVPLAAILVATAAAWFIPMLYAAGGAGHYFEALWDLWNIAPGRVSSEVPAALLIFARVVTVAFILVLALGPGVVVSIASPAVRLTSMQRRFILVWTVPALLFFTIVFLKFVNSGYLLLVTPPLFALLGRDAAAWFCDRRVAALRFVAALAVLVVSVWIYARAPLYFSVRSVREFEQQLATACRLVRSQADPQHSLIIGFDAHFLGYRHAAYYLPEFTVTQYPEVRYRSGTKLYIVKDGRTRTVAHLDHSAYRQAILFPLPPGVEYEEFLSSVLAKASLLRSPRNCGMSVLCALPIAEFPRLFPATGQRVYTTVDTFPGGGNE